MGKADDNAAVVRRGYAAFNAADMKARTEICCIVFEAKDGQIFDGREHFYDVHAWNEFWA